VLCCFKNHQIYGTVSYYFWLQVYFQESLLLAPDCLIIPVASFLIFFWKFKKSLTIWAALWVSTTPSVRIRNGKTFVFGFVNKKTKVRLYQFCQNKITIEPLFTLLRYCQGLGSSFCFTNVNFLNNYVPFLQYCKVLIYYLFALLC